MIVTAKNPLDLTFLNRKSYFE